MSIYNVDPALIAAADQHMRATSDDLDVCLKSYRIHRGQTDSTIAFIVLTDNIRECLTFEQACDLVALAVQRLADEPDAATGAAS